MTLTEAHHQLKKLGVRMFTTNDAVAALSVEVSYAAKILSRLARAEHVIKLARGRWALSESIERFALPEALTAPTPSYVSLYSALHHHGLIEQIPEVVYAVTLAPTRRVQTPLAVVSLHRVAPAFFLGFYVRPDGIKLATQEKALADTLYLRQARSRLFRSLPELELPPSFSRRRARSYLTQIASASRRRLVSDQLERVLER